MLRECGSEDLYKIKNNFILTVGVLRTENIDRGETVALPNWRRLVNVHLLRSEDDPGWDSCWEPRFSPENHSRHTCTWGGGVITPHGWANLAPPSPNLRSYPLSKLPSYAPPPSGSLIWLESSTAIRNHLQEVEQFPLFGEKRLVSGFSPDLLVFVF